MKGIAIFISAPSGTGKSTIIKELLNSLPNTYLAISATTRDKRVSEIDGKDYNFVSREIFNSMIEKNEFIEFTKVFNNYYGTPKSYLDKLDVGKNIIFDITVDGVKSIYDNSSNNVRNFVSILLLPPSIQELQKRLSNRNTESKEKQTERLQNAYYVLSSWNNFDYFVTCNEVDETVKKISCIIESESLKLHRLNSPPFIELIKSFK